MRLDEDAVLDDTAGWIVHISLPRLDDRMNAAAKPRGKKFFADFVGPFLLLALTRRDGVDAIGSAPNQLGSQCPHVIREVNVL